MTITAIFVGLSVLTAALMVTEFQSTPELRSGDQIHQLNHYQNQINQTNVKIKNDVKTLERMLQHSKHTHTNLTIWEKEDDEDCLNITVRSRNFDMNQDCAGIPGNFGENPNQP